MKWDSSDWFLILMGVCLVLMSSGIPILLLGVGGCP